MLIPIRTFISKVSERIRSYFQPRESRLPADAYKNLHTLEGASINFKLTGSLPFAGMTAPNPCMTLMKPGCREDKDQTGPAIGPYGDDNCGSSDKRGVRLASEAIASSPSRLFAAMLACKFPLIPLFQRGTQPSPATPRLATDATVIAWVLGERDNGRRTKKGA